MSEGNGESVIKIERRGIRKFALGDGEPFAVDVVHVVNEWYDVDRTFRNEAGVVPPEKVKDYHAAVLKFVRDLAQDGAVNMAEAQGLMKRLTDEAEALQRFFGVITDGGPSSPPSSTTVVYSQ
jgi:hypothetical protein